MIFIAENITCAKNLTSLWPDIKVINASRGSPVYINLLCTNILGHEPEYISINSECFSTGCIMSEEDPFFFSSPCLTITSVEINTSVQAVFVCPTDTEEVPPPNCYLTTCRAEIHVIGRMACNTHYTYIHKY